MSGGSIGIAGSGRVAQALGRRLREAGQPVIAVASRNLDRASVAAAFIGGIAAVSYGELHADRILIAVSSEAIVLVADQLPVPRILLHTCGAAGPEILRHVKASVGSMHPLQTFPTAESGYLKVPGSAFAIDGDADAVDWAEGIAILLHGEVLRIPAVSRAIYHAGAVMASNHVVAVISAAVELMGAAGVASGQALRALGPLIQATVANCLDQGPTKALTGPVARGDTDTIQRHLTALQEQPAAIQALYRAASLQALHLALARGLDADRARLIEKLLHD